MNAKPNELQVLEAYTRDVGRGVARIDTKTMEDLDLVMGDVIEITGKRKTVAKCLPPHYTPEELEAVRRQLEQVGAKFQENKTPRKNGIETKFEWTNPNSPVIKMKPITVGKTIRIDGLARNNAGIAIGENVAIRKVVPKDAEKITVVPLENIP